MNANELADELDIFAVELADELSGEAATTLRQQADRIAELEKLVEEMKYEKSSGVYDVSSKPVGRYYWESVADYQFMAVPSEGTIHYEVDDFPLYTHPVKQLSDENLNTIREALLMIGFSDGFINYDLKEKALAIIKEITE